ncbi:MAG: REP-associated tyrosine transposase [Phycisphaerae bacterium]
MHNDRREKTWRKTCNRFNVPGHAHALTFSCYQRRPLLVRGVVRTWFMESLGSTCQTHRVDLWAYVLMPEHVHLLLYPTSLQYSMSQFLSDLKLPVTRKAIGFAKQHDIRLLDGMRTRSEAENATYRFWQRGGGYDRNLTKPDSIFEWLEYIHRNPVRRGLVKLPEEWYWSSAGFYSGHGEVPLEPDISRIPWLG